MIWADICCSGARAEESEDTKVKSGQRLDIQLHEPNIIEMGTPVKWMIELKTKGSNPLFRSANTTLYVCIYKIMPSIFGNGRGFAIPIVLVLYHCSIELVKYANKLLVTVHGELEPRSNALDRSASSHREGKPL